MNIGGFAYIVLAFGISFGLMGLPPITRNLIGSFLSSSHLSAFAQTPFSTNRVTAGQQQSIFGQHQGPTLSFLPVSNQSANAQTPSTTTAGDGGGGSSQNQSGSNTTTNNAVSSNTNNTTK